MADYPFENIRNYPICMVTIDSDLVCMEQDIFSDTAMK